MTGASRVKPWSNCITKTCGSELWLGGGTVNRHFPRNITNTWTLLYNLTKICIFQEVLWIIHTGHWDKSIINSLAPGKFESNFRYLISQITSVIDGWGISCELALRWMSLNLTDDESTLVQVMAWCRQATSHYLRQCWPRSLSLYGVTRPQWVKSQSVYIQDPNSVITVPADVLAPNGARTSAGTVLTIKLDTLSLKFSVS